MHDSKNQFHVYKICEAQNDNKKFLILKTFDHNINTKRGQILVQPYMPPNYILSSVKHCHACVWETEDEICVQLCTIQTTNSKIGRFEAQKLQAASYFENFWPLYHTKNQD